MASATAGETRTERALQIALAWRQWARLTLRDGGLAWGIPSSRDRNRRYITTAYSCDCKCSRREGDCKHSQAVRLLQRVESEIEDAA